MNGTRRFGTISPSRLFAETVRRGLEEGLSAAEAHPVPTDPAEAFAEAMEIKETPE